MNAACRRRDLEVVTPTEDTVNGHLERFALKELMPMRKALPNASDPFDELSVRQLRERFAFEGRRSRVGNIVSGLKVDDHFIGQLFGEKQTGQ